MFTENSVGKKVTDGTRIGIIKEFDGGYTNYPVSVDFGDDSFNWYTSQGVSIVGKDGIKFLRQGSPDARRIVAMLAKEWRESKAWWEGRGTLRKLYKDAKQLLGEN